MPSNSTRPSKRTMMTGHKFYYAPQKYAKCGEGFLCQWEGGKQCGVRHNASIAARAGHPYKQASARIPSLCIVTLKAFTMEAPALSCCYHEIEWLGITGPACGVSALNIRLKECTEIDVEREYKLNVENWETVDILVVPRLGSACPFTAGSTLNVPRKPPALNESVFVWTCSDMGPVRHMSHDSLVLSVLERIDDAPASVAEHPTFVLCFDLAKERPNTSTGIVTWADAARVGITPYFQPSVVDATSPQRKSALSVKANMNFTSFGVEPYDVAKIVRQWPSGDNVPALHDVYVVRNVKADNAIVFVHVED